MITIFLSHAHTDRPIADALARLLGDLFGEHVRVERSTDQSAGGGIPPGAQWLPWITDRITAADKTYVLLTPNSMDKPWVLWESGAAAGVALVAKKESPVVPVTFGITDDDVPSPFSSTQIVRGDTADAGGITRLLQDVNQSLGVLLGARAFASTLDDCLPAYLADVQAALQRSSPLESLLASVPHSFSAAALAGYWATSYTFSSGAATACHADVAALTAESDRRMRAMNVPSLTRTQGHKRPFLNEVQAELANRHLIGHWKNLSDTRYFGAIHLAVLPGECVMEGSYTSFESDICVESGRWKWVRIDRATVTGVDLARLALKDPATVHQLIDATTQDDGAVDLGTLTEPAP